MPVTTTYPRLSQLLPLEKIPNNVEALRDALASVFDEILVKDLIVSKSIAGDAGFYSLTLVSKSPLGINIPMAQDLKLVLNPSITGDTEVPIYFDYSWLILRYIKNFSFTSFDNSIRSVFEILLDLAGINVATLLQEAITTFYSDASYLEDFVTDFNTNYSQNISISTNENLTDLEKVTVLSDTIVSNNFSVVSVVFESFIAIDLETGLEKLKLLFARFFNNIEERVQEIIQLDFNLVIEEISAGLQFPHKWLRPVDEVTNVPLSDEFFSILRFNAGSIAYSASGGFSFNALNSFSLNKSEIANTGLIAEFSNLKIDLQKDSNIPEADADGRPLSFKGAYADNVAITFPSTWFDNSENNIATTARLSGYNMLIGTGGISGTIALDAIEIPTDQITTYYEDAFSFIYPITLTANNSETTIETYSELLKFLNLNRTSFEFSNPISVLDKATETIISFNNLEAYNIYLSGLATSTLPPRLVKTFGSNGFEIWFTSFDITLSYGQIVTSNIQGGLKIPKFKDANGDIANIDVFGHLDANGGFNITASEEDGFAPIVLPNVFELYINALEIGRESNNDPFYLGTACDIVFTNPIIKKFIGDQRIVIERLRIYSNGSFEIIGGAIALPTNFTLNLGPIEIAITGINFGSFQGEDENGILRKYNYFGFDGAINLGTIGIEGRGEGVKYYYTVDDNAELGKEHHSYVKVETIAVDLTIPGNATPKTATAIIKGWLSVKENEFAGGVELQIPSLRIAGSAAMRVQPKAPAFLLDTSIDLSTPIPLASTGLGVTGFRGLLGYRYVAEKEAIGLNSHEDSWYDYYTAPERGINENKFNGPDKTEDFQNPVSLGAGATISTLGSGNILSLRVMVLLSIPNMILIDGRASILSKELGLDDTGEPPFFAFMILAENGIEIGAGVDFKLPQSSGSILDMHAAMQAGFFYDNPAGWYINMGTRDNPVSAKILSLVKMQSFLTLSSSGIEAGARVSFDFKKRFGPIDVEATFVTEVGGFISFERPQIGGYMYVDASAEVGLFGIIRVGASFSVYFAVEAAKPFLVHAKVRVCGKIKVLFIKKKICANVKIRWQKSQQIDRTPIAPLAQYDSSEIPALTNEINDSAVKGVHMLTGETFEILNLGENEITSSSSNQYDNLFDKAIIPLDTFIDIKFDKALLPNKVKGIVGGFNNPPEKYEDIIPPVKVIKGNELRQVKHRYEITEISIKASEEGSNNWVDYNPYEAVIGNTAPDDLNLSTLHIGQWQKSEKAYNAIRLLAQSPFSFIEKGEPGWFIPEQIGITPATLFCEGDKIENSTVNWLNTTTNSSYTTETNYPYYQEHQTLFFNVFNNINSSIEEVVVSAEAEVVEDENPFKFSKSLKFANSSSLDFKLPNPATKVFLKLTSKATKVEITYYKSIVLEGEITSVYEVLESNTYTSSELVSDLENGILYESLNDPISRVVISPILENKIEINKIYDQIELLFDETYDALSIGLPKDTIVETPTNETEYYRLLDELKVLEDQGCNSYPIGIGSMQIQEEDINERKFAVGRSPIAFVSSDDSCDICELHKKLEDHYTDCFKDNYEDVENIDCLEEFLSYLTNCGSQISVPKITTIDFPDGNCCERNPLITGVSFPNGNCCGDTQSGSLAVVLYEGTCISHDLNTSETYYVSDYNIKLGDVIYVDKSLTIPLTASEDQYFYYEGNEETPERFFSIEGNGNVINRFLCNQVGIQPGLVSVSNCSTDGGLYTLVSVDGNIDIEGSVVYENNSSNRFNGGNNLYRVIYGGEDGTNYDNFNTLDLTDYLIRINNNGRIINIINC